MVAQITPFTVLLVPDISQLQSASGNNSDYKEWTGRSGELAGGRAVLSHWCATWCAEQSGADNQLPELYGFQ